MKENRQAVTHEAGEFIRRNLRDFPSPLSGELFKNLSKPKEVHYIASSTENAQARYLPQWIRNNLTTPERKPQSYCVTKHCFNRSSIHCRQK